MISHKKIWSAIDKIAKEANLTPSGLAKKAGLDSTSFNKSKRVGTGGKLRWPSTESIYKILKVANKDLSYFSSIVEPNSFSEINIIANIQNDRKGFSDKTDDKLETLQFPRSLSKDTIAIKVKDYSLEPFYSSNNILIVSKDISLSEGDKIILKTIEGTLLVKKFIKQDKKSLTVASLENTEDSIKISNETIDWIGKITWASQ